MTNYEQLAAEIRDKRNYREEADGTIFCSISGCPGSVGLRCQRTFVPICTKCAVRTPVGYISREAAREQQDKFFDAETSDYIKAGLAAFFANLMIGFVATRIAIVLWAMLGFFGLIIIFFVATGSAGMISEIVWRVLNKKRGRRTDAVITVGLLLSCVFLLPFTNLIVLLIYAGIVITSVRARFQLGIRL